MGSTIGDGDKGEEGEGGEDGDTEKKESEPANPYLSMYDDAEAQPRSLLLS
jgi:hypothetical protein